MKAPGLLNLPLPLKMLRFCLNPVSSDADGFLPDSPISGNFRKWQMDGAGHPSGNFRSGVRQLFESLCRQSGIGDGLFVTYLLIFTLLAASFLNVVRITRTLLEQLFEFVRQKSISIRTTL